MTRSLAFAALARSPAQRYFERWSEARLAVLTYHAVSDVVQFSRQMQYLQKNATPLSLHDVLDCLRAGGGWPLRPVLVTFDDGDRSVLEIAAPILESFGIPAVCFVVSGVLDSDQPHWWVEAEALTASGARAAGMPSESLVDVLRWLKLLPEQSRLAALADLRSGVCEPVKQPQLRSSELLRLEKLGVAIGNHTHTHPCLPRCSTKQVHEEIRIAHQRLSSVLGHPPRAFAFPDGGVDDRSLSVLDELGYEAAFAFDHRLSPLTPESRFAISRLRVSDRLSLDELRPILSGLHPALHDARARIRLALESSGQGFQ